MKEYDKVFKEMEEIFKEIDKTFKKVDTDVERVFSQMDSILAQVSSGEVARKIKTGPWTEWFAWHPVKLKGKRVWLKKIFRRRINTYVDMDDWSRYEYGTAFDVIKGDE